MPTFYVQSKAGPVGFIVDEIDLDLATWGRWRIHDEGYAVSGRGRPLKPTVYLHRLIMLRMRGGDPIPEGLVVDHINANRCDNRRSNLRLLRNDVNVNRWRRTGNLRQCVLCRRVSTRVEECPFCLSPMCPACGGDAHAKSCGG